MELQLLRSQAPLSPSFPALTWGRRLSPVLGVPGFKGLEGTAVRVQRGAVLSVTAGSLVCMGSASCGALSCRVTGPGVQWYPLGGTQGPVRTCHRLVSLRALHLPTWENLEGSAGLTIGVLRGQQACGGRRAQNYVVWTRPSSQGSHSAAPTAPGSVPPSLAARPVVHGFTTSPVQLPVVPSCP